MYVRMCECVGVGVGVRVSAIKKNSIRFILRVLPETLLST